MSDSFDEIVLRYGYKLDSHKVTTQDGYILTLHRVRGRLGSDDSEQRSPFLFFHGAYDSSDAMALRGPEFSPLFYYVNAGYDMWICNSRGNKYSRAHQNLDPDSDPSFWDFSFVEMAEDVRASVEYVLEETNANTVALLSFAVAARSVFVAMLNQPEWFESRVSL